MTTVKYTKSDLKEAKKVLENALRYIEYYGFNISEAIRDEREVDEKVLDLIKKGEISKIDAKHYGTVCFIGAARIGAGVQPNEYIYGSDYGGGKKLTVALELMDMAVEKVDAKNFKNAENSAMKERYVNWGPGAVAETMGFILREQDGEVSQAVAEDIFKSALTYIHNELDHND